MDLVLKESLLANESTDDGWMDGWMSGWVDGWTDS